MIGIGLPPRYLKRSGGGVEPRDSDPLLGEKAGEGTRSAPDVKDRSSAQNSDKSNVVIKIVSLGLERVIDLRKSSILEDRIGHFVILAGCPHTMLLWVVKPQFLAR